MPETDLTADRLKRLATFEAPGGGRVMSLYLNLDPQANLAAPANRRSAVNSLLDEAARAVEGEEELDHDMHRALRDDVTRVRDELDANLDAGWAQGAHALALFVSGPAGLFEVVRLPRAVDNRVVIAPRPAIQALAETGPLDPWALLVFDGDDVRLFEARGDRLEQLEAVKVESVRDVAALLARADGERGFVRILVGTTEPHFAELTPLLDQHLAAKLIGRFDAGADWESPHDLREKAEPLLVADETHREADALARAAHPGVRGFAETLPALYERRVETLLVEPGLDHPGVVCPRCRWAAAEERGDCPMDGETMVDHPNLIEWAIGMAVEQDAPVMPIRRHNDLADHDGIAAAVRF